MARSEKVYICNDCNITFALRTEKKLSPVHCPSCADYINVIRKGVKGKLWTQQEINTLLRMLDQDKTHMQIAASLKRSMRSVQHKVATLRREGEIKPVVHDRKCSLCDEKHRSRGYCKKHYEQWIRGTLREIPMPLSRGGNEH